MNLDLFIWEGIRSTGIVAYLLLSASMLFGIAVSARALDGMMKRSWVYEGHQTLSVISVVATVIHVGLVLANQHIPFDLGSVLVPFISDWRPVPTALGIVSMYLIVSLTVSSYIRSTIGQRNWRIFHYASFGSWVMAFFHGITSGSDVGIAWNQYLYLGTGAAIIFFLVFRILNAAWTQRSTRSGQQGNRISAAR